MDDSSLGSLRRFVSQREPGERCDLCRAPVAPDHSHLLEVGTRKLVCGCRACSLLFTGHASARYRLLPTRVLYLRGFELTDEQWDELQVPVNLAFFTREGGTGRVVAAYPSPAGPTESQLALDTWQQVEAANPVVRELEPDVEALLVNRIGAARDHFIVPIDECYRLVGLVRVGWRGLSGGSEVWEAMARFLVELKSRSRVVGVA